MFCVFISLWERRLRGFQAESIIADVLTKSFHKLGACGPKSCGWEEEYAVARPLDTQFSGDFKIASREAFECFQRSKVTDVPITSMVTCHVHELKCHTAPCKHA